MITCFGSLNIDTVYTLPHFPRPGETLHAISRAEFPGGKGLNQSVALARAGSKVRHAGKIGEDGLFLLELLRAEHVDCSEIEIMNGVPSGQAVICIDAHGQNTIVLSGGANQCIDEPYIESVLSRMQPGELLLLQNEISGLPRILESAAERGLKVALNFAPFSDETARALRLETLYCLILNETESAGLSGTSDPEEALQILANRYPDTILVITLGANGAIASRNGTTHKAVSPRVPVVDTTSAGDTFIGYFLTALDEGRELSAAMNLACRAAAITVSRGGAGPSIPRAEEVAAFPETPPSSPL